MHSLLRRASALIPAFVVAASLAAPAPAPFRAEIESLLKVLQSSGCEFNRNGAWFSGAEAKAHLTKKLDYLVGKSLVKTSEDFINLGASTSSSSGKPYLVRCGSAQPTESKTWLQDQLKVLRQSR